MIDFQFTVVSGGVIGLSIVKSFSSENKKVLLIEKNNSCGQENSLRNSGVIHAGLYYTQPSKRKIMYSRKTLSLQTRKTLSLQIYKR